MIALEVRWESCSRVLVTLTMHELYGKSLDSLDTIHELLQTVCGCCFGTSPTHSFL